jgi:hypothetical protein
MSDWYYTIQGQQQGPVPESQLRALIQTGQVAQNEYVFREGMADWAVVSACQELIAAPGAALVPPVPGSPPAAAAIAPAPPSSGVTIGNIFQETVNIFKEQWVPLVLGSLIIFGISFGGGFMMGIVEAIVRDRHGLLSRLFGTIINGPMTLGIWIMALNAVDRRLVKPTDTLQGFKYFIPAFVLNLLLTIAVFAGLLALIIGAFVVAALLMLSWGYMADRKCGPIEALTQSFHCAKSNFLLMLLLILSAAGIMIAGVLCLFIGIIPAMAFASVMFAVTYRWLNPQLPASAEPTA